MKKKNNGFTFPEIMSMLLCLLGTLTLLFGIPLQVEADTIFMYSSFLFVFSIIFLQQDEIDKLKVKKK